MVMWHFRSGDVATRPEAGFSVSHPVSFHHWVSQKHITENIM